MQENKKTKLLQILSGTENSVPATAIANMLGVSERTVRNYIKEINADGHSRIQSSRDGYRLEHTSYDNRVYQPEAETRVYRVLSDLLTNKKGINAFDEADSLYVSSSTVINTIIPRIKRMVKEYDLRIESQKYQFSLIGSEKNKRKLIGHIATNNTYGFFNSTDALEQLFPNLDISNVMKRLYQTCQESNLFLNDYALNNLLIHILVILIRLESGNWLEDNIGIDSAKNLLLGSQNKQEIIALADRISETFEKDYQIQIPECDYQQLLILIALNIEHETVDIRNVISQEFIYNIISLLSTVSHRYCTPEFTNDFALQFALHMYYVRQRSTFQISYPNPIGHQFKKDYAHIFDMAVYFSHRFSSIYHIELNEDEIAFIAFHIGSYLESTAQGNERISCIVIAEAYHAFVKKLVRDIESKFSNQLIIREALPLNRYQDRKPACDLIITTIPLITDCQHVVLVNPVLTKQNISAIHACLDEIHSEKELDSVRGFLQGLLHKELYFRNVSLETTEDYINFMGYQCMEHGYVDELFIQDVLLRESLSCTAFTDTLAVPHSVSRYADKSFICVIHNDLPIPWNLKNVHFIFMIGIMEQDMKYFKGAFDLIIELFNSKSRTFDILKTNTFEEFCEKMY